MKRMWMVGVLALVMGAIVAAPAGAATGGNSANAKLCQKDGWKTLFRSDGSQFASQGECVSYGAKGNTILTEPPNAWQAACEQNGGTFSVSNTTIFGDPLTPPAFSYKCTPASRDLWVDVLTPICLTYPDGLESDYLDDIPPVAGCVRSGTT